MRWLLVLLCGCDWFYGVGEFQHPDATAVGSWASVAAGSRHTCALDRDGHLACWGEATENGLGASSLVPMWVGDSTATWTAVTVGGFHTCAISDGAVSCWGTNDRGQINGTAGGNITAPTRVGLPVGTPPVDAVSAGAFHSCAIAGVQLLCWGDPAATGAAGNSPGQLGAGTTWRSVAAGNSHTCAIDGSGAVACWGVNNVGQAPPTVTLPAAATAIAAGNDTSCAIAGGQIWCWGSNDILHPGMGNGASPKQIVDGDDWADVVVGNTTVCGVRAGAASCFGAAHAGAFGDGVWSETVQAPALSRTITADAISLSRSSDNDESACVLGAGNIACWGDNLGGQLGTPATLHLAPVTIPTHGVSWASVATGETFTCATDTSHLAWCWGGDDVGQISGAACAQPSCDQPLPIAAAGGATIDQLIAGFAFTCTRQGTTFTCRGTNDAGQLASADPSLHQSAVSIIGSTGATGGYRGACAVRAGMTTLCWGAINGGKQPAPIAIANLPGASVVRLGRLSSAAIATNTSLRWYWGMGFYGDLGDGMTHPGNALPTAPNTLVDGVWSDLAFEADHACGITGGAIACFGTNYRWESEPLNQMSYVPTPTVIQSSGSALGACTSVAAGGDFSCGVCAGVPYCWGDAQHGLLGRGVDFLTQEAADLVAVPTGHVWQDIAIGGSHACALATDNTLVCWGTGVRGEIGDGSHGSNVPVAMFGPP